MAWKFIQLDQSVSQKQCQEFLDNKTFMELRELIRIQKTCANGGITLKLYPKEGVNLEEALNNAKILISLLALNHVEIMCEDVN